MSQELPDRLSSDPRSPFHDADLLEQGVGIRFNGTERQDVEEYCVSEGWIRVTFGKSLDRRGRPMTIKLQGQVEPFLLDADADAGADPSSEAAGRHDRDSGRTDCDRARFPAYSPDRANGRRGGERAAGP